jgi:methylglutaconyl-CoA hydratase
MNEIEAGSIDVDITNGIATVAFYHPKKNSLPGTLLRRLAAAIDRVGVDDRTRVVVLKSEGDGPFCAGASFDELLAIDNVGVGREFFLGFARVILAMKRCPKFIICRVQGKGVGGALGLMAASDYVFAVQTADIKLSEFAIGIGPFVIGLAVERKIGPAAFAAMSIDTDWRDAAWAQAHGLYTKILASVSELDESVAALAAELAQRNPEAAADIKRMSWRGTDDWDKLLTERAETSARLVLSDYTSKAIAAFRARSRKGIDRRSRADHDVPGR